MELASLQICYLRKVLRAAIFFQLRSFYNFSWIRFFQILRSQLLTTDEAIDLILISNRLALLIVEKEVAQEILKL